MDNPAKISCKIISTDYQSEIGLEIWLNNQQLLDINHVDQPVVFVHEFSDDEADHELRFVLKNKQHKHTKIDENNNIIQDARLVISDVAFEEIPLEQVFFDQAVYTHNSNGAQDLFDDKFFGDMGCNGTVSLKFTAPVYLWILEKT